jgi:small GTP-binding protein
MIIEIMSADVIMKLCILGDAGVGKTSLVRRYTVGEFSSDYLSTIGTSVMKKNIVLNKKSIDLIIWDIAGQKKYHEVRESYYRGSSCALVVCDITRKETFTNLPNWISHFRKNVGDVPVLIITNKNDLWEERKFEPEEVDALASKIGTFHIQTSAKTGEKVEEAFGIISEMALEYAGKKFVKIKKGID